MPRWHRLLGPQVDLILCETVASLAHAKAVLEGALTAGKPVWLAVTVDDEDGSKLRSGEPVPTSALSLPKAQRQSSPTVRHPRLMHAALKALAACGLPYGAYANGFQQITKDFLTDKPTVDSLQSRRDLGPEAYAAHALKWVDQGATIVGGCCEVGPAHIAELSRTLQAAGHRII